VGCGAKAARIGWMARANWDRGICGRHLFEHRVRGRALLVEARFSQSEAAVHSGAMAIRKWEKNGKTVVCMLFMDE